MTHTTKTKIVSVLIISLIVTIVLKTFFIEGLIVAGDSMSPTIQSGEYVFIFKQAYTFNNPKRGDVVVAYAQDSNKRIVKRIVGMPGERFEIKEGLVKLSKTRSGDVENLEEKYIASGITGSDISPRRIDQKEYFGMGDNRNQSIDSRLIGPINDWDIKGKVFLIFNIKKFSLRKN